MNKKYKEMYESRIKNHKEEYYEFDLDSYIKGYDDGYSDGCTNTRFNIASLIYEHWNDFVKVCHKYEGYSETELIAKMSDYFNLDE